MVDAIIASVLAASVPLVLAALGELVAERAGILNLGVEGMMLVGALRAVGESPAVARSLGLHVTRVRYAATLFGGAAAGLAGAYYALAQFKMWQEGLTAGNGWIALALVVFAGWRPWRLVLGALLFGGVTSLGLNMQAAGVHVSPFLLA